MTLSKDLYTKGIQCSKLLWLQKYNNTILEKKDTNSFQNHEIDRTVKVFAYELFENGVEIPNISEHSEMASHTQINLNNNVKTIYNATFIYDEIIIVVDILTINKDGLSLYHVENSSSSDTASLHTLCLQYYVLQKLGYNIKTLNSITLNRLYQKGNTLDIKKLFKINNITKKVIQLEDKTHANLENFKKILSDQQNEPSIDIGEHCSTYNACEAKEYCWKKQKNIPDYSIFNIFKLGSKKQKQLYSKGIVKIEDIPQSFSMSSKQKEAIKHYGLKNIYYNKEAISKFLNTLTYPIYHLDCKTFYHSIPNFSETTPYEKIPFHYSIHIEHQDGTVEYKEYLSPDNIDPRYEFIRMICKDIPQDVTVLGYHIDPIQKILKHLAHPYNAKSEHLLNITENMKDLMTPFEEKHIVSSCMKGSYSKKNILQSLLPEFSSSYLKLQEIKNEEKNFRISPSINNIDKSKREKIRNSFKEYSKLDNFSNMKILKKLKEI